MIVTSYLKSLPRLDDLLPDPLPPPKTSSPKKSSKMSEKEEVVPSFPIREVCTWINRGHNMRGIDIVFCVDDRAYHLF